MAGASCVVIVDGPYILSARNCLRDMGLNDVSMNYEALKNLLDEIVVEKLGFQKPDKTLLVYALNPKSEGQKRFIETIRNLYTVYAIDYWRAYVPLPEVVSFSGRSRWSKVYTLTSLISYKIGILASQPDPQVIVVSGTFSLFNPLLDFTENYNGKAAIVFFQRFLDPRWNIVGFSEKLQFYDLEPHSEELFGVKPIEVIKKSVIDT